MTHMGDFVGKKDIGEVMEVGEDTRGLKCLLGFGNVTKMECKLGTGKHGWEAGTRWTRDKY